MHYVDSAAELETVWPRIASTAPDLLKIFVSYSEDYETLRADPELIHFYQGVSGIVATGVMGFLYGLAFLLLGRNLWVVIVAHAASHVLSFTAMYLGLV
ncbi:MAG: CPBP family intramembrane metalloprotease [Acidobacteria bacterium]|nr:CPBP family intramembrane metalloprotease [Acidobacteriota bacterium]